MNKENKSARVVKVKFSNKSFPKFLLQWFLDRCEWQWDVYGRKYIPKSCNTIKKIL